MKNKTIQNNNSLIHNACNKLQTKSFYSAVDYDYETFYSCKNGSDCCNNDLCRCGQIQNVTIKEVNINYIIDEFIQNSSNVIDSYCIDRLFRNSDIAYKDGWEINICGGYYGQEISGCAPKASIKNQLCNDLSALLNLSDIEKIKYLLQNEYGFLLPELIQLNNANVLIVPITDIIIGNLDYSRKLNKSLIKNYESYNLPKAICINSNEKYRLIDGYHRMHAALNMKLDMVSIIQLY